MTDAENPSSPQPRSSMDRYREWVATIVDSPNSPAPPERSLWKGGFCAKAMYGAWVMSGLITVLAGFAVMRLAPGSEPAVSYAVAGCVLLLWVSVLGTYLYRRLGLHYELTTQRFIHQEGVLLRRTDRLEVIDIEDISYSQGIVERMLGIGSIRISGRDQSHPELNLRGIDKVPEVAGLIDDVRREERRRRSLHTR
jgi:uncharacterized membrane protein YdbT with pleckstrin-like domain